MSDYFLREPENSAEAELDWFMASPFPGGNWCNCISNITSRWAKRIGSFRVLSDDGEIRSRLRRRLGRRRLSPDAGRTSALTDTPDRVFSTESCRHSIGVSSELPRWQATMQVERMPAHCSGGRVSFIFDWRKSRYGERD